MSLKAKLEAVIYAAEEPVALAQLAQLFADEALEWKADQQAAAEAALAAQSPEPEAEATEDAEFDALLAGTETQADLELPAAEPAPELTATAEQAVEAETGEEPAAEPAGSPAAEAPPMQVAETQPEDSAGETAPEPVEAAPESTEPDEAELKRQARQRDKEVRAILKQLLDELVDEYASDERGVEIREIAGGYRMATKPECHDVVRTFVKGLKPALKLSLPALETLAVVAYKQPVTAPEVNEIRGVESSGVFGSLLARKLIATAGRKQVIGRPILYKTTREFLMRFGLKDLGELPSMEEFEKMAAELEEPETEAETAADDTLFSGKAPEEAPQESAPTTEETTPESTAPPVETAEDAESESNGTETEPASPGGV